MLVLSKRLHSIFVLRCFNDCFAVLFLWLAIYAYQRRMYTVGSILFSLGVGVKMSLLLSLPAVAIIILLTKGVGSGLRQASLMAQVQILLGLPFMTNTTVGYLSRAFEFTRQFLFKWTVNWKFLGEDMFLSREFSTSLLIAHATTLVLFALTRWLKPAGISVKKMLENVLAGNEPLAGIQHVVYQNVTPDFVLTTILTANTIGMLFARSLHYQFFAYLSWATPFLLWKSRLHPISQFVLWALQEWAWNVYPSNSTSSKVVVTMLAVTVIGAWWGTGADEYVKKGEESGSKVAPDPAAVQ